MIQLFFMMLILRTSFSTLSKRALFIVFKYQSVYNEIEPASLYGKRYFFFEDANLNFVPFCRESF